jgi:hypothetical protein
MVHKISELLYFRDQVRMQDDLLIFGNKAPQAEEPEAEPNERTVPVLKLTEGLDTLKLASRCLRILIRTSSEKQQLDNEL